MCGGVYGVVWYCEGFLIEEGFDREAGRVGGWDWK